MKEPIYRVVLLIIEVNEDAFFDWLRAYEDERKKELAIEHFICACDVHPEVRRIYMTAKNFESYSDAERCFNASLREFDFEKASWQYFKALRIEKHDPIGSDRLFYTIKATNELTGG